MRLGFCGKGKLGLSLSKIWYLTHTHVVLLWVGVLCLSSVGYNYPYLEKVVLLLNGPIFMALSNFWTDLSGQIIFVSI